MPVHEASVRHRTQSVRVVTLQRRHTSHPYPPDHRQGRYGLTSLPIAARVGIMTTTPAIGTLRCARLLMLVAALFASAVVPASAFVPPHHQTHPWRSHRATSDGADDADADDGTDDPPPAPKTAPVATRPGVNGPVRLSSPSRVDDYKSPVNFEAGVTKGPGPLSPRWSDSGRWEKDQDRKAESGEQSAGEQQFLLKEKYGTYFRVPNPATLMTKIICTIGPSTDSPTTIGRLLDAGMSAARINMSHGSHEYAGKIIDTVREVAKAKRKLCPIILDTKGPEIRVTWLSGPNLDLQSGDRFIILSGKYSSDPPLNVDFKDGAMRAVVSYPFMASAVQQGDVVLLDDGKISLIVSNVSNENEIMMQVIEGGRLVKNKGVNLPGCSVDLPHVTDKDVADIAFGVEKKVEYIAHSFTRSATGINSVRELPGVVEAGISIIAKIENQEAVDNFAAIARVSDAIMVARGDLGVEIPLERVASVQKRLVASSNALGIPVIVATELLDSMMKCPRPTRAEASDVANAVFDGADCVMLSGETAAGDYPIESVQVMTRICKEAELDVASSLRARSQERMSAADGDDPSSLQYRWLSGVTNTLASASESGALRDAFAKSAIRAARETDAELIIAITRTGLTAHALSKFFAECPVMVLSDSERVCSQVLLHRSVTPYKYESLRRESCVPRAIAKATELGLVKAGSRVLLLTGDDGLTANRLETFVVGEEIGHTESEERSAATRDEEDDDDDEKGEE